MASDIISALNMEKESLIGNVYVVKEINGCEGSFVTSCVLGHQAKKKSATLLITFHQLLEHYHSVGLRMGYNLKNQESNGLLRIVSPTELIIQKILEDESIEDCLNTISSVIDDEIVSLAKEHGSKGAVCIYVDGLTHLFDLGYSLRAVNVFARSIIKTSRESGCFVMLNCAAGSEQEDSAVLAGLLSHAAHTSLELDTLASGRSADVSGHLAVRRSEHRFRPGARGSLVPIRYHFRLFDRGVKLFAPGVVGL